MTDLESFVMPLLRQIMQKRNIDKTQVPLSLSEMTHNVSLYILHEAYFGRSGAVKQRDIVRWSKESPDDYALLEDLHNLAPNFLDKHKSVVMQSAR